MTVKELAEKLNKLINDGKGEYKLSCNDEYAICSCEIIDDKRKYIDIGGDILKE